MTNLISENLLEALLKQKSKVGLSRFLSGLLSPSELQELAKRLEIVRLLKQGLPQREIASRLGVGIATVTRGSRELKDGKFNNV